MHDQPTTLLLHTTRAGRHHDWLIGDPRHPDPDGPLWTARVQPASRDWRALGQFELTPLPPHRRAYLHHQGPVSGDRGTVRRVDEGRARPLLWTPHRRVLAVQMRDFAGQIELREHPAGHWRAIVLD